MITRALEETTSPHGGRSVSGSFLHNGTVAMFEEQGFERTRRLGKHHWVVAKTVPPWS